jgi:hypothetical protein
VLVELAAGLIQRLPAPYAAAAVPLAVVGLILLAAGLAFLGLARWGASSSRLS